MNPKLSIYNWSLAKLLSTETDSLKKARIRIIFAIIVFSLIKLAIAIPAGYYGHQHLQFIRSLIFLVVFVAVLKLLLINRNYAGRIGVIMIWTGLFLTWTNVFITAQAVNIVTIQVVIMVILSSFYLLTWKWGMIYSFLSVTPVIMLLVTGQEIRLTKIAPDELASPAYEIIVLLNFLTIVITHFLYYQALNKSVTEKEALNIQLQQAVKEANKAVQSKADFLSTMSHELRTPLNSVIGMTQLLLNSPYSKEQAENLKIVNFSAMNLHMLINDILDFSKMGSDMLNLEAINVDLYKLINDICAGMRFQAEEKGLTLLVHIDEEIKMHQVITDPTRITQIIYNLLGNAIKFTHAGKVCLELKVIRKEFDSMEIKFSVTDTGIGISKDQQEVVFEAFTQASSSTTRNFGGTGLGLAIVKRLLSLFKSDIYLASSEGKGSDFFFNILFKTVAQVKDATGINNVKEYDLREMKVLIVEDNQINSLLLKKIFSNWNNHPVFATNGYEAIEKVESSAYDVILMDIHMPLLDGYETTRSIRNMSDISRSGIPIIALTASVSNDLCNKIKEAGMNDYINKPFNSDDLYKKIKEIGIKASRASAEEEKVIS